MMDRFARCKILFENDFIKIQNANILLLGVGGVGGFCLEALYRTGIGSITIVDFDVFDITNQNRQLGSENIDEIKVDVLSKNRVNIKTINIKITPKWIEDFDFDRFDLVIDAIDDMSAKVALAHKCSNKLLSSMGGAKKLDPTLIQIASIWKTNGDGLAKKFRYELRKSGFKGDFDVVFSPENPKCQGLGSFVGVTGSFGLTLASLAIKKILAQT
ncbi:MAG: tRNA threonylcarbamoyladenosine dehydratase [Epsilonproteobacteria bacterium]|nr:tRNA threonylcarbamoyladenosine dehydratase [Campylobacterota bacterium]